MASRTTRPIRGTRERPATLAPEEAYCPVHATICLLEGKWMLHVLRALSSGTKRFNELAAAVGGVNPRTLSKRLATLEAEGIVERRVLGAMPPWVEYSLTRKGRDLHNVIDSLVAWGRRWMKKPPS